MIRSQDIRTCCTKPPDVLLLLGRASHASLTPAGREKLQKDKRDCQENQAEKKIWKERPTRGAVVVGRSVACVLCPPDGRHELWTVHERVPVVLVE